MTANRVDLGLRLERVRGIEPPYPAWEAGVLPLNYTRGGGECTAPCGVGQRRPAQGWVAGAANSPA